MKLLLCFLCLVVASTSVVSQEAKDSSTEESAETTEEASQSSQNETSNASGKQSEDYFDPTEDISEDYAVPFPTDI